MPAAWRRAGAARITAEFDDGVSDDERVDHKGMARVMRAAGIAAYRRERRGLINRDFTAAVANTKYVGDSTCRPLDTGANLYLAMVIDRCSPGVGDRRAHAHRTGRGLAESFSAALKREVLQDDTGVLPAGRRLRDQPTVACT